MTFEQSIQYREEIIALYFILGVLFTLLYHKFGDEIKSTLEAATSIVFWPLCLALCVVVLLAANLIIRPACWLFYSKETKLRLKERNSAN